MQPHLTRALLLIADISGYTRFMLSHEKALTHSQMIIGGLIESLMEQVDRPLTIVELEGDALFMYTPRPDDDVAWESRGRHVGELILRLFRVFHRRLAELAAYSVCHCHACRNIGELKLKVVAHSGDVLVTRVGAFPVLSGPDVIKVHRLLKNSVDADQYVLLSESAFQDLPLPDGVVTTEGVEEYDVGTIKTLSFVPEIPLEVDHDAILRSFSDENVGVKILRFEVQREYSEVAKQPDRGYHFNTGRRGTEVTEYDQSWVDRVPPVILESFAGTGNPFSMGELEPGQHVVDVGSGSGLDAVIAGLMVGGEGHVIGVDMTSAMVQKARAAVAEEGLDQVEFREGFAESLPVPDDWADVVISNGAVNLCPDKARVFGEMYRVLRPGGRIQIADITVAKPVPEEARRDIDLWTN